MKNKFNWAIIFIVAGAILRLVPHPHNATPIAAMALAGGLYLGQKYLSYVIPFLTLFLSDLVLNNTINRLFFTDQTGFIIWSDYMWFGYLAFGLTVILGSFLRNLNKAQIIIGGAMASSLLFFVITNTGTWLIGSLYPNDFMGLMACYAAAIPFFINTLLGNLVFTALFVLGIGYANQFALDTKNA